MRTLLMRFAAPIQSWGIGALFERRGTERHPTKSGIVGFCASSMGILRHEDAKIAQLAQLRVGTRTDAPGTLIEDFHMVHAEDFWDINNRSKPNPKSKLSIITRRYYLSDATFLVGIEGSEEILKAIENAVKFPWFPQYLGRRNCPPEGQVILGIIDLPLLDALKEYPPLIDNVSSARIVIDADNEGINHHKKSYLICDYPISFNSSYRNITYRRVEEYVVVFNQNNASDETENNHEHDIFGAIEENQLCI